VRQFSPAVQPLSVNSLRDSVRFFGAGFLLVLLALAATALPAAAQSEWQLYGGTSFLWAKTTPDAQQLHLSTLHEYGWQTAFSEYPWHWFGGTLEASGFYGRPDIHIPADYFGPGMPPHDQTITNAFNAKTYTIMFGPTFAYKHNAHVQPFGHVLIGGINEQYSLTSKYDPLQLLTDKTPSYGHWIFGWGLGGGADVSINRLVALRGQVDWIPTTFKNLYNDRENNVRISFGLVFRFGNERPTRAGLEPVHPSPSTDASLGATPSNSTGEAQPAIAQHSTPAVPSAQPVTASGDPAVEAVKGEAPVTSSPAAWPAVTTQSQIQAAFAPGAVPAAQRRADEASLVQPGGGTTDPSMSAPPASAMPAPVPHVMVEFWSAPTGADVEIDGEYSGSTFSTIALLPGQHTITIRKKDFATWQRTIKVTSGNVRVAAYLEQVRATVTFH
jgi:hypothetical protein